MLSIIYCARDPISVPTLFLYLNNKNEITTDIIATEIANNGILIGFGVRIPFIDSIVISKPLMIIITDIIREARVSNL